MKQRTIETNAASWNPWATYIAAREEARGRGDRRVGTEHLLVCLLLEPGLAEVVGVDDQAARAGLAELDREALAAAGIDLRLEIQEPLRLEAEEPAQRRGLQRRPTVKAVLQGRLPLTPAAKKVLEAAWSKTRGRRHAGAKYVLASLLELEPPDPAAELLAHLGVDTTDVRERLDLG